MAKEETADDRRYFEIFEDASGQWRWRLKGGNGQTIATSHEGYSSKQACRDALEKVKRSANAPVRVPE
ncbi:MAG: DUF1508 domain-containing protein [Pseudomonadota bacterium]